MNTLGPTYNELGYYEQLLWGSICNTGSSTVDVILPDPSGYVFLFTRCTLTFITPSPDMVMLWVFLWNLWDFLKSHTFPIAWPYNVRSLCTRGRGEEANAHVTTVLPLRMTLFYLIHQVTCFCLLAARWLSLAALLTPWQDLGYYAR